MFRIRVFTDRKMRWPIFFFASNVTKEEAYFELCTQTII